MRNSDNSLFFNRPSANADFEHWSKSSYWKPEEAVALSFGKSPELVSWDKIKRYKDISPFVKKYKNVRELVARTLSSNDLKHAKGPYGDFAERIKPSDFVDWAKRNKIEFPVELEEMVLARGDQSTDFQALSPDKYLENEQLKKDLEHWKNKHKKLVEKTRASTNSNRIPKMALAVIAKDKYKYGEESAAIGTMLSYFVKQGLTIDDQTLRGHINEGLQLLKNKKSD